MSTKETLKYPRRNQIILSIILFVLLIAIVAQRGLFLIVEDHSEPNEQPGVEQAAVQQEIDISGNHVLRQYFQSPLSDLKTVSVRIKVGKPKTAKGTLSLQIFDENGVLVAENTREVKALSKQSKKIFARYSMDAELEKGHTYELVITSQDVEVENGLLLYMVPYKGTFYGDLFVNDKLQEGRLMSTVTYDHYNLKMFLMLISILIAALIWIWFPFEKCQLYIDRTAHAFDLQKFLARVLFAGAPFAAFMIIQCYTGYGFKPYFNLLFSQRGMFNLLLYFLFWGLLFLICNRTKYTTVITIGFFSILGLANYFVWSFRDSPIIAADLMSIGTAMDVADHYTYALNFASMCAIVYTVVYIAITLRLKSYHGLHWKKRLCVFLAYLIPFGGFYKFLYKDNYFKKHDIILSVWEPSRDYASNGCLLSFLLSYMYYQVDKPAGYSPDIISEIASAYPSDSAHSNTQKLRPNVIAIMNETFSDLSVDGDLHISEDCMPFIHNLHENTVKGNLYVSVHGGNTANSEFEFQTGCSMAFMPFRSIPYDYYLKRDTGSLTSVLKDNGYVGNYAIHPGKRTSWNRDNAYPLLGFNEFFCKADFPQPEYIRELVTDKCDYEFLLSKFHETRAVTSDPFYSFTVTIQNHGGYSDNRGHLDSVVTITDTEQYSSQLEQYINLIKISDDALKELLEYFENIDEPTIIVFFGDHQPSLDIGILNSLFGKSTSELTLNDIKNKYTVPYLIWANYDIEEAENVDMSANYLSTYLLNLIDAPMSGYQKYLLDLMQKVPVITANFYCGDDGVLHAPDEPSEYSDLLLQYQQIQYNNIFDSSNKFEDFYKLKTE